MEITRTLREELTCSVCMNLMRPPPSSHAPISLQCSHTFCSECLALMESKKGSIECPQCRYISPVTLKELRHNITLIHIMDGMHITSIDSPSCNKCDNIIADVISYCEHCQYYLCSLCTRSHDIDHKLNNIKNDESNISEPEVLNQSNIPLHALSSSGLNHNDTPTKPFSQLTLTELNSLFISLNLNNNINNIRIKCITSEMLALCRTEEELMECGITIRAQARLLLSKIIEYNMCGVPINLLSNTGMYYFINNSYIYIYIISY